MPVEHADIEVNISHLDDAGYWNIKYTNYARIRSGKLSTFSFTDSPLSHSPPFCCSSTKGKLLLRGEEENVSDGKKRTDGLRSGTEILPSSDVKFSSKIWIKSIEIFDAAFQVECTARMNCSYSHRNDREENFGDVLYRCVRRGTEIKPTFL